MVQGATWGVGIICSYLVLFIVFYVQTYGNGSKSKRTGAGSEAASRGLVRGGAGGSEAASHVSSSSYDMHLPGSEAASPSPAPPRTKPTPTRSKKD